LKNIIALSDQGGTLLWFELTFLLWSRHGLSPNYMVEHFIPQDSIHSHSTRFSKEGCYYIPKVGSSGAKTFAHAGCQPFMEQFAR